MAKMTSDRGVDLKAGDRFMQGIFVPFGITDEDVAFLKREGGMGSTGV